MLEIVTSASNRLVKLARLLSTRHGREKHSAFVVEGVRAVDEALAANVVQAILVDQAQADKSSLKGLMQGASKLKAECAVVDTKLFSTLAETKTPQGALAIARDISISLGTALDKRPRFIVVADSLQDPGNLGTLIRLADAVGAEAFVATKGSVDMFNPKVVRASMGSLFHVSLVRDVESLTVLSYLRKRGYAIIAADVRGQVDHFDCQYQWPLAVVFGNEGAGLSAAWTESAQLVRIPMPGRAESLNVGVAAGVLLYEIVRQLRA